jgi:hypothetical protein
MSMMSERLQQAADRFVSGVFEALHGMSLNDLLKQLGRGQADDGRPKPVRKVARKKKTYRLAPPPYVTTLRDELLVAGPEEVETANRKWSLRQREGMPFTVRFMHNGKRIEKSTGTKDRTDAESMAKHLYKVTTVGA